MKTAMKSVTIHVPATTANLGPGFDTLGLALDLWNETEFAETGDGKLTLSVSGEGEKTLPTDENNAIAAAALQAAEESRGRIIAVSDNEILAMQRELARLEGIWVEPASAAGLAGLAHEINAGRFEPKGRRIVAICTGHGLKDPDIITKEMTQPLVVAPTLAALEEVILQ